MRKLGQSENKGQSNDLLNYNLIAAYLSFLKLVSSLKVINLSLPRFLEAIKSVNCHL